MCNREGEKGGERLRMEKRGRRENKESARRGKGEGEEERGKKGIE